MMDAFPFVFSAFLIVFFGRLHAWECRRRR